MAQFNDLPLEIKSKIWKSLGDRFSDLDKSLLMVNNEWFFNIGSMKYSTYPDSHFHIHVHDIDRYNKIYAKFVREIELDGGADITPYYSQAEFPNV